MASPPAADPGLPRRRILRLVALGVAVTVVHLMLLSAAGRSGFAGAPPAAAPSRAAPAAVTAAVTSVTARSLPLAVPAPRFQSQPQPQLSPAASTAGPAVEGRDPTDSAAGPTPSRGADPPGGAAEVRALQADGSGPQAGAVPLYPTRLPPPTVRRYDMQRGLLTGQADWVWRVEGAAPGAGYTAQLIGRVAGVTVLDWDSRGRLDAHGVAPDRFVTRRKGRGAQATNFQREALTAEGRRGKVTFSAATSELPLVTGSQDRLSWMVQLGAVLAADPVHQAVPGREIVLWVVGTRGDAEAWTFVVEGLEPVPLPDGNVLPGLKLHREPRRTYDTRAEIWLDPAQHHLPLRARLSPTGSGEPLDLVWLGPGASR